MALPDITFVLNRTPTGFPLPGQDYISGIVFYNNTAPTGFPQNIGDLTDDGGVVECFQISDAEAVGITNTWDDETQDVMTASVTTPATDGGNTITVKVTDPFLGLITLGVYVTLGTDTTDTLVAAGVAAAINANTGSTGYSATSAVAAIHVTVAKGRGIAFNVNFATLLTFTITGTDAGGNVVIGAVTNTTPGVASKINIYHYHIAEYFRLANAQGNSSPLWVGIFPVPGSFTAAEAQTMQIFANGVIRQTGLYIDQHSFTTADITAAEVVNQAMATAHMPSRFIIAPDISGSVGTAGLAALATLASLNSEDVSINISQDGGAYGNQLYTARGKSISNLGAFLGSVSTAKVSQSIANPALFNIDDGTENDVAAFSNGVLFGTASTGLLSQLETYRYIFTRKFVGYTGTFFNNEHTCTLLSSNYAYISDNRVVDKIERLDYAAYLPFLSSNIQLNADGTIFYPQVKSLESVGDNALAIMLTNNELSALQHIVSPTQNIKTAGKLVVAVNFVKNGIARSIEVDINPVTSLT